MAIENPYGLSPFKFNGIRPDSELKNDVSPNKLTSAFANAISKVKNVAERINIFSSGKLSQVKGHANNFKKGAQGFARAIKQVASIRIEFDLKVTVASSSRTDANPDSHRPAGAKVEPGVLRYSTHTGLRDDGRPPVPAKPPKP